MVSSKGLDSKGLDSKGLDSKGLDSKGLDSKSLVGGGFMWLVALVSSLLETWDRFWQEREQSRRLALETALQVEQERKALTDMRIARTKAEAACLDKRREILEARISDKVIKASGPMKEKQHDIVVKRTGKSTR